MPADAYSRMDSSGSTSDSGSGSENLSSSPVASSIDSTSRERTDSEGADRQPRFILPGAAGSPPKVLTMDEVHKALRNVENMTLAHEIAVNPEFRLQPYEPTDGLEKNIKDMIHKAFWSSIREQLNRDPPCYDDAIQLLADIKEGFSHIISKNNQKALDRICEVLDSTVIRQQAEQGVLDFKSYANFIIQIMARSCAPVRDEEVAKLSEIDDVVDTFRGILETMTLMKLDMANCLMEAARKDVIANSVEYEKQKFKEYMNVYTHGFPATECWLNRHKPADTTAIRNWIDATIINSYIELLDYNQDNEFPETIAMDKERVDKLAGESLRLCICASALFIASSLPIIGHNTEHKHTVKQQISILLQNVTNDKDLVDTVENVWLQIKSVINSRLIDSKANEMDSETESSLKNQILLLAKKDSPIRSLMWKRLLAYVRLINTSKVQPPPPPGYTDFANELEMYTAFRRITFYNYSVFGEYYHDVLTKEIADVPATPMPISQSTAATTTTATKTTSTTTTSID